MGLPIRTQALSLLLALGAGAALGLLYDLLRPLRRLSRDTLWDALFCAAAAAVCFLLALREENGRLAGGQLLGGLLGFCLYLHLLSPLFLFTLDHAAPFGAKNWKATEDRFKKKTLFLKKTLSKTEGMIYYTKTVGKCFPSEGQPWTQKRP